jgi:hypothetical protein
MTPESRLLEALDGFARALSEYLAVQRREPAPDRELVNLAAAARRLSVARSTLNRWVGTGAVATVEIDGRRWVPSAELDRIAGLMPPGR